VNWPLLYQEKDHEEKGNLFENNLVVVVSWVNLPFLLFSLLQT
jgi:hypothetical protein